MEGLAVCIVPMGLPSGRRMFERALGAAGEMFPTVNWHRQLSALSSRQDHSLWYF